MAGIRSRLVRDFASLSMNRQLLLRHLLLLLATATSLLTATAQTETHKRRMTWKEKMQLVDSVRWQIRKASDEGRLLQWGDSILRSKLDSGTINKKKYKRLRSKLTRYDRLLHSGDSLLAQRYQRTNFDTAYISRPQERWTIKLRGNISGAKIRTDGLNGGEYFRSSVESEYRGTLSMAVSYRGIAAGIALNPMKLAGKNQDYELNLNSYSNKMGFDIVYLASKTYHGTLLTNGIEAPVDKGMVSQKALNLNFYYAFNGKRFSFPAAFSQSYLQRRSAGSLMVGASFDGQLTKIAANEAAHTQPFDLKLMELGIGVGYGYNLVAGKRWLFHLSVLPTFDIFIRSHTTENGERINMSYRFPSLITTERGAAVYSWRNQFVVLTMVYNHSVVGDKDRLRVRRDKWRLRLAYGFRF